MNEELKSCPFCFSDATLQETEGGDFVIFCNNYVYCGATINDDMSWEDESYNSKQNVINKWNRRGV